MMHVSKSLATVLSILMLLSFTAIAYLIPEGQAQSSTSQGYDLTTGNGIDFHLNVVVHTEPDGRWILNHEYQIDYQITITYLDQSRLNTNEYALKVYNPALWVNDWSVPTDAVSNSAVVWFGNTGTIAMKYTPSYATATPGSLHNGANNIKFHLEYEILKNNEVWTITNAPSSSWLSPTPITINIQDSSSQSDSNNPSNNLTNYASFIIIAIVVVIVAIAVLLLRKQKGNAFNNQQLPPPPPLT